MVAGVSAGPVDIKAITQDGTKKEASHRVSVTYDHANVALPDDLAIRAADFTIDINDVTGLDDNIAKTETGALAWTIRGSGTASITVDPIELGVITSSTTVGRCQLTFKVTRSGRVTLTKTIIVSLTDDNTIIDPTKDLAIHTVNFSIGLSEAPVLDITKAITYTKSGSNELSGGITAHRIQCPWKHHNLDSESGSPR